MKKLQLFTQLHLSEQSWLRTAEHCSIYLSSKVAMRVLFNVLVVFVPLSWLKVVFCCCCFLKDTEYLNTVTALTDQWKEQLTAFTSQLKKTEHAQREELDAIRQDIVKWLNFIGTQNK